MGRPLEVLERRLIAQAPLLIERALCESPDSETVIRLVRGVVIVTALSGSEALKFIMVSEAWAQFSFLYPEQVEPILSDARKEFE